MAAAAPPQTPGSDASTPPPPSGVQSLDMEPALPPPVTDQEGTGGDQHTMLATVQDRVSKLGFRDLADLLQQVEAEIATPSRGTTMSTPTGPQATPAAAPPTTAPATSPPAAATPAQAGASPAGAQPTPAQIAAAANDPANDRRLPEHVRQRVVKFRDEMRGRADAAEAQARTHADQVTSLTSQLAAQRAAEGMKIQLVQAGMREIEFGWFKLEATLAALKADPSPEAQAKLKAFDVAAWAAEQRKAQPFLFGEQPVPATTPGPEGAAPAPGAPDPAAVTGNAAGAGSFDARTADPKAFRERMEKHGFRYTGSGPPMKR